MQNSLVTIVMDPHGSIHMWQGNRLVNRQMPCRPFVEENREAEVFFQNQEDIESITTLIGDADKEDLEQGWPIVTNCVPSDYFEQINR